MDEKNLRKLRLVRFGLTLIPLVACAMVFMPLYLISASARLDWVQIALIPSIGEAAVVGVVCALIYFLYKYYLDFIS